MAYERAAQIDSEYAELAFRRGECCRVLGLNAEAAGLFRQARDQDALQFRADRSINETIRRAATAFADRRVDLLDAELLFATNSPEGLTGAESFYEHVHLKPEGNYLLARAVAEQVAKALSLESKDQWVSQSECLRLLGFTDWNRYDALEIILDRVGGAPFTNQVDHADQLRRINNELARYRLTAKPAQVRREVEQVSQIVASHPGDADLRWNLVALLEIAGDKKGAEEQWRELMKLQPQSALPLYNLAKLLDGIGRQAEAAPLYSESLRLNPKNFPARYALGLLCLRMDRLPEALRNLTEAVREKPDSVEARLALGQAFVRANRPTEAEKQWQAVLRLDPTNVVAKAQLRERSGGPGGP
jgi:tetratricopeptide (TPR) repeat protein